MKMKNSFLRLFKDDLVRDAILVFIGTSLGGAINLLYHLVSVRLLTPEDYGTFNVLISFIMFSLIAIGPLGTALTRYFTEYISKNDFNSLRYIFLRLIKVVAAGSVFILVLSFVLSGFFGRFLKVSSVYIIISGISIIFSLFYLPNMSLFQSFQRFKIYSGLGIFSAVSKLAFGSCLMFLGWGVLGSITGYFGSTIVAFIISLYLAVLLLRKEVSINCSDSFTPVSLMPIFRFFLPVSAAMLSFTLLTNIDVIFVKHFFSPSDSGYYSIAQMVGKMALFMPSALAVVILPKSTEAFVNNRSSSKILYKSLFMAGTCCFLFTMVSFFFPSFILRVLAGRSNPISVNLVGLFAFAMSFYALLWIVINYLLAVNRLKIVYPLFGLAMLESVFIYKYHTQLINIVYSLLFFGALSFFISLWLAVKNQK